MTYDEKRTYVLNLLRQRVKHYEDIVHDMVEIIDSIELAVAIVGMDSFPISEQKLDETIAHYNLDMPDDTAKG